MVRVISVHHFTKQDVTALERSGENGVARGKKDIIFIGGQHKIDVRDLKNGGILKGSFPTVDLIQQLIYCQRGNYVCTLESKPARHGGDHTYVRVYLNWECDCDNQPMKARIAGKVTPGSQSGLDVLEMVEIPTKKPIQFIACCQTTGNIALVSGMSISILKFCLKTHDISKMKFVDFEEMIEIDTAFVITEVAIIEDIIGCVSDTEAHVFQVVINASLLKSTSDENQPIDATVERQSPTRLKSITRSTSRSPGRTSESSMAPFRGRKIVAKDPCLNLTRKSDDYIDLSTLKWIPTLSYGKRPKQADSKFILFPSLVGAQQCGTIIEPGELFGPLSSSDCSNVRIKLISGHGSSQRVSTGIFDAITLLHRRIDQVSEPDLPFSNLRLQYIYHKKDGSPMSRNSTHPLLPMTGEKVSKKIGVTVFVTTPHIGYLYHITLANKPLESSVVRGGVFSYTAPVDTVALEPCLLHALTLTGLETYTLRPHPYVIESSLSGDQDMIVPPHWEESVCLVGLRPFLNIKSLTLTDSCLSLIACNEEEVESDHTAYSLHLPTATSLYREMIRVGLGHKNASPTTYFHLLLEAHLVLMTALYCQPKLEEELVDNCELEEKDDLIALLQDSSALLGDYYASCRTEVEWNQAVQYFKASTLTPDAVLERLPSDSPGLIYILSALLLKVNTTVLSSAQTSCIIDVLEKVAPEAVSNLLLKACCLKEYKKDKVLNIIKQELGKTSEPRPADVLALALIFLEKGAPEQISSALSLLRTYQIIEVVLQHSRLLVERDDDKLKLSPFSQVLVEQKCDIFIDIFVLLMGEGTLSLNAVVDAFVNAFPIVSCGLECNTNSLRLRDLIENFFLSYGHLVDTTDQREKYGKAISVLISLYVASLLGAFGSESEEDKLRAERRASILSLFGDRHSYLNDFPPFHSKPPPPIAKCRRASSSPKSDKYEEKSEKEEREKDEKKEEEDEEYEEEREGDCNCSLCFVDLLLLQSLLSSGFPSCEDRATILKLVESNPDLRGASSLHVLCLEPAHQLPYILKNQPNALLQFCKDTYESPWEWEGVVSELIKKVNSIEEEEDPQRKLLENVLNEILSDLVMSSSFDVFTEILPKCYHEQFRSQIRQCHSAGMAQFLKEIFVTYADNVLNQFTESKA